MISWSHFYLHTLKEAPSDAEIPSHKLMVRSGAIKKVASGIYTYQNLALRAIRKFEKIIRFELDKMGGVEILMPMVHPRELWEESGRWETMGPGLLKFQNRNKQDFCLGATHEEVITDLVRNELKSYKQLPKHLYQIQTKYRDEIRPRFGLMRGREFIMKDAYTFDSTSEEAIKHYKKLYKAYESIFSQLGVEFRIVEADAGSIGGSMTHEFHILADSGEDEILACDQCKFAANVEVAPVRITISKNNHSEEPIEEFETPNQKTIKDLSEFLDVPEDQLVKTLFFEGPDERPVIILLRGSDELNPVKLKNFLKMESEPRMLKDLEIQSLVSASPGSCGPVEVKVPVYMDQHLSSVKNMIVGANKDGWHLKNVNPGRDFKVSGVSDFKKAVEGDHCSKCEDGAYKSFRGIEVGHVFYLGTKYSEALKAHFLDANGKSCPLEMGCYGIGVSRTIQAVIEQCHDKDGIQWPKALAPFDVHICMLDPKDDRSQRVCKELGEELESAGLDVFIDDRDERPGIKFKDADLLGFPVRVTIGKRGLDGGNLEISQRKTQEKQNVPVEKGFEFIQKIFNTENLS